QGAEPGPDRDVTGDENRYRHVGSFLPATVSADGCKGEDHWHRAGQHHRHHHSGPHKKEWEKSTGRQSRTNVAAHLHAEAFAHAGHAHPARFMDHVSPGGSSDAGDRAGDDPTLARHDRSIPVMNPCNEPGLIRIRKTHLIKLDGAFPGGSALCGFEYEAGPMLDGNLFRIAGDRVLDRLERESQFVATEASGTLQTVEIEFERNEARLQESAESGGENLEREPAGRAGPNLEQGVPLFRRS